MYVVRLSYPLALNWPSALTLQGTLSVVRALNEESVILDYPWYSFSMKTYQIKLKINV